MAGRRSSGGGGRVTSVPITALSNQSSKVLDLIPLPVPIFVGYRVVRWLFRHWYLLGLLILYFFGEWYHFVLLFMTPFVAYFSYVWGTNRHHSIPAVLRAIRYVWFCKRRWDSAVIDSGGLDKGPRPPRMVGIIPFNKGSLRGWRPIRIVNDYGTALAFSLDMSGTNATYHTLDMNRERVADDLRARRCRVRKLSPGYCELVVEWERNPQRSLLSRMEEQITTSDLPTVEIDDGVELALDTSLLVVGESGSGKSNLAWNIANALNIYQIPHNYYIIDPKRVELADFKGQDRVLRYAYTPADITSTINEFHSRMMRTLDEMEQEGVRKVTISETTPLNILIVDELLALDRALITNALGSPLGDVLTMGRAGGYIIIGLSQLGQVDALGRIRDLFPQRVCMATKSADMTNAVLGPRAEERGARCSEITQRGIGYVYTDAHGTFQRFRPPFIPDGPQGIGLVASGGVWLPPEEVSPHVRRRGAYVYTLWGHGVTENDIVRAENGEPDSKRPLYVGKAVNPSKRMQQHAASQPWWNAVDHNMTQISTKYATEEDALREETERIQLLRPVYNLVGRNYHN